MKIAIKPLLKLKEFDVELIFASAQKLIEKTLKILELNDLCALNNGEYSEFCGKIIAKVFQGELKQFFAYFVR